MRPALQ